jgi:glycosyltransferase involved in cell wall biosynthesis
MNELNPRQPRLRILTWQEHGNYLYYLSQVPHDFWLVTRPGHPPGYAGRTASFPWGDNVHEIAPEQVAEAEFDCVLYQSRLHWEQDRRQLLSAAQRRLPAIYLEHDPPQQHPVEQRHWAQSASLLVHVTPFNALMWDNGRVPVRVVEHGVLVSEQVQYSGELRQGLVAINHLQRRGRRLGYDIYEALRSEVPLTLVGMDAEHTAGGLGEIPNLELPAFMARYRFFFNPIRWTSLGLAVIEAMSVGLPILGLATTELSTVIVNGRNGWLETDPRNLLPVMRRLLDDPALAQRWGEEARVTARSRFGIERFVRDWSAVFAEVCAERPARRPPHAVRVARLPSAALDQAAGHDPAQEAA